MTMKRFLAYGLTVFASGMVMQFCSVAAFGMEASGELRGVTRNIFSESLPEAEVIVRGGYENFGYSVVSGRDGTYVVEDLRPGR
jgi:hypothetical protein